MAIINFSIELIAIHCNNWPWLQIICDQSILYDGEIKGRQNLNFSISTENQSCNIKLLGIKKHNDTKLDANGKILEDKSLRINSVLIDDIVMGDEFIKNLKFKNEQEIESAFVNQTFYSNGIISIDIEQPVTDWIIKKKFIELLPTYGTSKAKYETKFSKFEYGSLYEKISKIEALINDQNTNL